jgi:hypothetical protein
VTVVAAAGVTEHETVGYRTKLTATGRSNSETNPADWGGITSFTDVDWRTNGWNRGSDNVDALLLSNGARAVIDVKPFVQDTSDNDYSIQNRGMTLEMEVMISQVMERGATVISCLCDNDGQGYPMGIKITTEEAGLYFGGVEEITTAEDNVDANGNYIDYQGNIVDEANKVPLKVTRPHGTAMNIAIDKWIHLAFVVQPVSGGHGIAMLFINGVLSRANTYVTSLRQNTPAGITLDSDKANVRIRSLRYYRTPLSADEALSNWIIDRPTAAQIQTCHQRNTVGDLNNTTDTDGNIAINRDALLNKGRGILTIIRSTDTAADGAAAGSGTGLSQMFRCKDKKENFKADLVRWEPPLDAQGNSIGDGFEARNIRMRIQGTSSVKYPYKNLRIYLTTQQGDAARSLAIGGVDVTASAGGYPLRGSGNSIEQSVICAKTDFVDSSLVMNTGGAHLFHNIMHQLNLDTPPQQYDARVRQAIDGIPCDIYAGTSENGTLTYMGQFVLNNEKSKSGKIFGMEGVSGFTPACPIALEALTNSSPMTLFQPAGSANSTALANQLAAEFDNGFEFNYPEDAVWATIGTGSYAAWSGAQTAIKRLFGWIYDCVPSAMRSNPEYGTQQGWSDVSKSKWVSSKFKTEAADYFNINHLLTYYLFTDYWASVDQRAKNIMWRTWDGLKWYATYYDGDTAVGIRNDAFLVYLYNVTRDTYDNERAKFAYEGHNSWLWCLVLANFEDELKECATRLRNQLTTEVMLNEFNNIMQGNWSERQYNKSGKLKYIDTINDLNYIYTLTGNRELHRTQFLTDRARLLDARYGAGNYNGDVITFTVVRDSRDSNPLKARESSLTLKSGDLYYFGYKLNGIWLQGPSRAAAGESLTLNFTQTLATNDPLMLGGASCIKELDFTNMGSQLNGTVGLSMCTMLAKLVMPVTTFGIANAPLDLGNTSKLEYVDITGQTAINTGISKTFDISKHTRLATFLAGGTELENIILPEGAPIETLVMPATLQTLTLRYLPKLNHSGLTLQGTSNITALNFAECPNLSWQTIMQDCANFSQQSATSVKVRIEGMSGRVSASLLRQFMTGYDSTSANPVANLKYRGLSEQGIEQSYPALIGTVILTSFVDDYAEMRDFFAHCGLTVLPPQYSEYVFHDEEKDPANITNEDNKTGYAYRTGATSTTAHPNGYYASGHIQLLRDKCQPVTGYVNPETHKMHIEPLSKTDYTKLADGTTNSDIAGGSSILVRDAFLYLPRYFYKGINNFKVAKKHFFLSSNDTEPMSTATRTQRLLLSELASFDGKVPLTSRCTVGSAMGELGNLSGYITYKVDVEGYKQVRFPGFVDNDQYSCSVFTDASGNVISRSSLMINTSISGNPMDFDSSVGDYNFLDVPDNAKYMYFCVQSAVATLYGGSGEVPQGSLGAVKVNGVVTGYYAVLLTDSTELEAIEPDWVEHRPELIGIYQGYVEGMVTGGTPTSGLRSISGKVVSRGSNTQTTNTSWTYDAAGNPLTMPSNQCHGTAQDFFNLARIRTVQTGVVNGEYTTVPYETSKDMANLIMVWFGTRDVETIVGRGSSAGETTGIRNSIAFGDSSYNAQNQHNKMWGLECWTGSTFEWTDKGCLNAPSFAVFMAAKRILNNAWAADNYYNILQQDGNERRVKVATGNQNIARTRFGRYCDIIASSFAGDNSYATCYACYGNSDTNKGRVLGRSANLAYANAGVAFSYANNASSYSNTFHGGRLCFFGEIENEEVVL